MATDAHEHEPERPEWPPPDEGDAVGEPVEPTVDGPGDRAPLPLEEPEPGPSPGAMDVCPSCGAPLRGADALVCLRCGYDLKTLRTVETTTGEVLAPEPGGEETGRAAGEALVRPMTGDPWLPTALAAGAVVLLAGGLLAGAAALYPALGGEDAPASVDFGQRLEALGRMPVLLGLWTLCGLGALVVGSWLFARPFGDLRLAVLRVLAVAAVARLASYVDFASWTLELVVETLAEAAIALALVIGLFRLKPRDALTLAGVAALGLLGLYVGARLVTWAT